MSTPVVLVPGAPVLVPELSGEAAADTASQVGVALGLLSCAAADLDRVLVLGSDPAGRTIGDVRASLTRWGAAVPVGRPGAPAGEHSDVPDAALIAWWHLDRAGIELPRSFVGVTGDGQSTRSPGPGTLVVVVADGPASLTPRAPVPEDPRGVALDRDLTEWLRRGGPLPDPGGAVAEAVGWWSRPAWLELAGLVGDRTALESVSWAPFGVGYHAARWDLSSTDSPVSGGPR
ncbi:hypothetical protein [Dietzia psychralcaliphila]|uniref:hypothetical protein n=1 Tax=Dietzia psychralcaliphila TaxID=139021 RepID=UPI001C1E5BBF|nr:hypothetical protein [Dietzia psychralcaliphila]